MRKKEESRFQYHAHAIGVGGNFTRPRTEFLDAHPTLALPVTGGTVNKNAEQFNFRDIISFRSAISQGIGVYHEENDSFNTLVTVTIEGLNVLNVLTADRIVARLASRHYLDPKKPTSITTLGSHFEGLKLNGRPIEFRLDHQLMSEWDTYPKALKGCEGRRTRFAHDEERKKLHTSLATEVRPPEGCEGDRHKIYFPDLGMIHLAELHIGPDERRLTMLRFEFGCAVEGDATCGEVGGNGNPVPPV